MKTYDQCIALTNLSAMNILRRKMIDLAERGKKEIPTEKEIYISLKKIISQYFDREITPTIDKSIESCAERIHSTMEEYIKKDPEYELIDFICYTEKYLKNEIMNINRWCPPLTPINY